MSTLVQQRPGVRAARTAASTPERRAARWLAAGLAAIAFGMIAVAVLGPLVTGVIEYRVTETLRNQTIGLDAVSLLVVSPLALTTAVLVARGRVIGSVIAVAIGAYTAYMFMQYVLGPDYAHLPGNNQRVFPLALFLFVCGWAVALSAWRSIGDRELTLPERRARVIGRYALPLLALVAFGRYLPALTDWMSSTPKDKVYLAGPSFGWTIALIDLGIFLPFTVAACVGLNRRRPWATKALYAVTGWFGLVGPAVAAMAITMAVKNDPNGSTGNAVFMSVLGLAFLTLALVVYRPLVRDRRG